MLQTSDALIGCIQFHMVARLSSDHDFQVLHTSNQLSTIEALIIHTLFGALISTSWLVQNSAPV